MPSCEKQCCDGDERSPPPPPKGKMPEIKKQFRNTSFATEIRTHLLPILAVVDELRLHTANATDPYIGSKGG